MQKPDRKQTEGKGIWKVGRVFPKICLYFGTSFLNSLDAIENKNLCKQGKATLPIISVSSDRELSRKCTENWQAEKLSSNESAAWHEHCNLMAAEIKIPQR